MSRLPLRAFLLLLFVVISWGFAAPKVEAAPARKGPLVVLDPGHGGSNHGARGASIGRFEKELTLILARRTRKALGRLAPRLRVRLTRERDRYLTLAQRVVLANRWGASVFLSIHLNATKSRSSSGFETYILSAAASDKEASRLAYDENRRGEKTSPSSRGGASEKTGDVAVILHDLAQRAMHARSLHFAKVLQRALAQVRPTATNLGVRQAPFDVLMGLRMPGALVEVGFIDHVLEGKRMNDPLVQGKIAEGLARGIVSFLRKRPVPKKARK